MEDSNQNIKYLFEPKSIAVIGAARDENKIGYKILKNILTGGYRGEIYPINPQGGEILGTSPSSRAPPSPREPTSCAASSACRRLPCAPRTQRSRRTSSPRPPTDRASTHLRFATCPLPPAPCPLPSALCHLPFSLAGCKVCGSGARADPPPCCAHPALLFSTSLAARRPPRP